MDDPRYRETLIVAEQAARWLAVMQSPRPAEREDFWRWLDASPLHVRELIIAARIQRRLRSFDPQRELDVEALVAKARGNIALIGQRPPSVGQSTSERLVKRHWSYAAAAGLVAVLMGAVGLLAALQGRETYVTKVGQQLVFGLADGSVVSLNTSSRLKVRFSAQTRDVYLPAGQALFEVKHDLSRPFRVHTASSVVEAVGTQFDVRVLKDRTVISVVEGAVKVLRAKSEATQNPSLPAVERPRLAAGEAATVNARGEIERTSKIDTAAVSAWKQQRLIFNEETLQWIVEEFNRYNAAPRLRVEGDTLRARRYNGAFDVRSPESLIEYLQRDPSIRFDRQQDEITIREAHSPVSLTVEAVEP